VERTKAVFRAYAMQIATIIRSVLAGVDSALERFLPSGDERMTRESATSLAVKAVRAALKPRLEIGRPDRNAIVSEVTKALAGQATISRSGLKDLVMDVVNRMLAAGRMNLPTVEPHAIAAMTEVQMDLKEALGIQDEELLSLVGTLFVGTDREPGLLSRQGRQRVEGSAGKAIRDNIIEMLGQGILRSDGVRRFYMDDQPAQELHNAAGKWDVRVTSIDNIDSLRADGPYATQVGIYAPGQIGPVLSVGIIWSSSFRVIIGNGVQTQDYMLLPDGRMIECEKSAEDNRIRMPPEGDTLSLGDERMARPPFVQAFEENVLRPSVDTKIRDSETLLDDYFMMSK
jgi:hypothetical protein